MITNAVALMIYDSSDSKVLAVMRGEEDQYIPNLWSLPSGYVSEGDSLEIAVKKAALQKLGVQVDTIEAVDTGSVNRENDTLHMTLYKTKIISGDPQVPQPFPNVTQYAKVDWVEPKYLEDAARKDVLSCKLFLASLGYQL